MPSFRKSLFIASVPPKNECNKNWSYFFLDLSLNRIENPFGNCNTHCFKVHYEWIDNFNLWIYVAIYRGIFLIMRNTCMCQRYFKRALWVCPYFDYNNDIYIYRKTINFKGFEFVITWISSDWVYGLNYHF